MPDPCEMTSSSEMLDEPMAPVSRSYIMGRIHALGHGSMLAFLASRPDVSYVQLGKDIQTIPLHIYLLQFEEAKAAGEVRAAVMDSYVRQINRYFPNGWTVGNESEFDRASALSLPRSDAIGVAKLVEFDEEIRSVGQCLRVAAIPEGWRPTSIEDPILAKAFNEGWPAPSE